MKQIEICGESYDIECNALTQIKYRQMFNKSIFDDIKVLQLFLTKQVLLAKQIKEENPEIDDEDIISNLSRIMLDDMGLFAEAATRMAFIMIHTADKKIDNYEKWLENIPSLKTNDEWIAEVAEFAVNCFC